MRRLLYTLALTLACAGAAHAQSGRVKRAEPAPTPPRDHAPPARGEGGEDRLLKPSEDGIEWRDLDSAGGEIYGPRRVARKAVILSRPAPAYTRSARRKGVSGMVRLRMVLASSGKVERIEVLRGLPEGLTEEAIKAAQQIKFVPAEAGGRKVSQYVVVEYNFRVH
jgi:TonB family protein